MTRIPLLVAAAALAAVAYACSNPAADAPKATVGAATEAPKAPAANAPAAKVTTFVLNPANTRIAFVGSKVTGSHEGSFSRFEGTAKFDAANPGSPTLDLQIDMNSLAIEPERLAEHLKSADFFDVATYPKATFQAWGLMPEGIQPPATHKVIGALTLRNVRADIAFPATVTLLDGRLVANASFSINRKDFGIVFPGMPDDLIRDEVLIRLSVDARSQP